MEKYRASANIGNLQPVAGLNKVVLGVRFPVDAEPT